ncbi:hypothetical protein CBM2609_P330003 [Cupriavidus taiwanensis]|uniref:Uncharacterized protein n=1 Tax=Cupriavidus taiwanensis TaxID=164546 RepID=A0A375DSF2_9BURK|nr:hypothetical protein CBM2588_P360003 [Cupriavidus taiwanensis]SOY75905.1 hypothetical protein CBM2585_P330003 [Cupriavidus taiwanensis]SOY75913.1 hypothetical protein CBM2592_P360003 [Cupriavidus taiwanensis]SOY76715.1 hypothetical protein CBM2589_P330003 [Cupriavidus taiwanensis]SOZ00450.1 hypothetical protein CBM2591_P360003 [Cupriavidus taiwanensis]
MPRSAQIIMELDYLNHVEMARLVEPNRAI